MELLIVLDANIEQDYRILLDMVLYVKKGLDRHRIVEIIDSVLEEMEEED